MKRFATILLTAALLPLGLATAGCQDEASSRRAVRVVDARELPPGELGRIGARLHAAPEKASDILDEEGVDWEGYQAAVREVSANVESSRLYSDAFHAAGEGGKAGAGAEPAS